MYGPRFATPEAGQIVNEQIRAQSIQALAELSAARFIPNNTQEISPPFARGADLREKPSSLHFASTGPVPFCPVEENSRTNPNGRQKDNGTEKWDQSRNTRNTRKTVEGNCGHG
jgi:hypothetical protein